MTIGLCGAATCDSSGSQTYLAYSTDLRTSTSCAAEVHSPVNSYRRGLEISPNMTDRAAFASCICLRGRKTGSQHGQDYLNQRRPGSSTAGEVTFRQ